MKKIILPIFVFGFSILLLSCSNNANQSIAKMKEFTTVANKAVADSTIDDKEAVELNKLIAELNKIDDTEKNLEKELQKEENKKVFDEMGSAIISLMFCEGADKLKGLE